MSRRLVTAMLVIVALALPANAGGAAAWVPQTGAIRALLDRSAAAWNRGDLTTFMRSYERSPNTEYVSARTILHGYDAIRAHYAAGYAGAMGTLTFSDVEIRPLGSDYAVVIARWHLARAGGTRPGGIFTLVLHRSATGWRIITDHSP